MNSTPSIILCGYERGGTTLLSEIFYQNGYRSGFECGVLMCESPLNFREYKPYFSMLMKGWGISEEIAYDITANTSFSTFYNDLIKNATCLKSTKEAKLEKYYDKTPVYMSRLGACLNRTEFINKAVVITRDPRSVIFSWAKRACSPRLNINEHIKSSIKYYSSRYLSYYYGSIAHRRNPDVLFISFEQLCADIDNHLKIIGSFVDGVPWTEFGGKYRFENVSGNDIDKSKIYEFERHLSDEVCELILNRTSNAATFFAEISTQISHEKRQLEQMEAVNKKLKNWGIHELSYTVEGHYFEPETYLLKYSDILNAPVNPIEHFRKAGIRDGRFT